MVPWTSFHLMTPLNAGAEAPTHGFWNPPPGRWCGGRESVTGGQYSPAVTPQEPYRDDAGCDVSAATRMKRVSTSKPLLATIRPIPTALDVTNA